MKVERFEQAHELTDGQLVTDAEGKLWQVGRHKSLPGQMWLMHFSDEYAFEVKASGETYALGEDAPLPWSTVKVVPDEPAPTYGPAEFAAALLDQYQPAGPHGCRGQRLLWASPPHGPSCLLAAGHEGDCEFPETWVDPVTGKTIAVASHGRGDQA